MTSRAISRLYQRLRKVASEFDITMTDLIVGALEEVLPDLNLPKAPPQIWRDRLTRQWNCLTPKQIAVLAKRVRFMLHAIRRGKERWGLELSLDDLERINQMYDTQSL
jgi:hypothetical protein